MTAFGPVQDQCWNKAHLNQEDYFAEAEEHIQILLGGEDLVAVDLDWKKLFLLHGDDLDGVVVSRKKIWSLSGYYCLEPFLLGEDRSRLSMFDFVKQMVEIVGLWKIATEVPEKLMSNAEDYGHGSCPLYAKMDTENSDSLKRLEQEKLYLYL